MSIERYDPAKIESKWYRNWMKENLFAPSMGKGQESFCIVIPPPNVTGSLHMGHAWDNTIQDILVRWARMEGKNALWIPGTDHAGIATQWMVEKLLRERGTTKEEIGRETFLEEVWAFKEESHGTIVAQLQSMGVSCDWSRERFTLDDGLSRAVRRVFVSLFKEGLIYRDNRMVSWCPRCLTALSDLEVAYQEHDSFMYHFRYPMIGREGHVAIATTRPETMLGDGAVAVNENDERYTDLVGTRVMLPLVNRELPIIADPYPDPAFGSGAVKVTAAHDPNDFEMGKRHNVPMYVIMHEDGRMNDEVPEPYRGKDRFEVRKLVIADLEKAGLMEKVEQHVHTVGHCSRCDTIIEPMLSLQWFVKIKPLADKAIAAVKSGDIELLPQYQEKVFFEWMNNIRDWCISRQLWWGHRIPVWYCQDCGEVIASEEDITTCTKCGSSDLKMDEDVLDTWFSSGLWPFSTMGWPDESEDLKTFYPTSVLVTGYDILFFWVARMAMFGLWFMDEKPFHQVLLHGLLRDQFGEKMSKTKGNGLDPLDMVEKFGADALRFTLAAGTVPGRDMILPEASIEGNRNFINKFWNATRFTLGHLSKLGAPPPLKELRPGRFERWIVGRFHRTVAEVREFLELRRFDEACRVLYTFIWHEFCDWYVEISKDALTGGQGPERQKASLAALLHVLSGSLKLLHPIMPFVTEELWAALPTNGSFVMMERFPSPDEGKALEAAWKKAAPGGETESAQQAMEAAGRVISVIQLLRTVRGENGIKPRQKIDAIVVTRDGALRGLIAGEEATIRLLADVGRLSVLDRWEEREGYGHGVGEAFEVFLSLAGLIDVGAERTRIGREVDKTRSRIQQLSGKLENPSFLDKAPPAVVEKSREELHGLQAQLEKLDESLEQLPKS